MWRPGGRGSGIPWHWRPGCLPVVPHCLVAPTRRQLQRLDHHACDPPDGTLCIRCCLDTQRCDVLSPSTWSTLSAVGQPSAVPCNTGARWIPQSLLSFPEAFEGCWQTQTAGRIGIVSISRPCFWSFHLSERISTHTPVWPVLSLCPICQLKLECLRSILLWPAPPLRYHLSRWKGFCRTPALFSAWEWGSLSATCFWQFWWEDTQATVLVFPGPQVSFPSRSLFPLLGRSLECHISNCH